jgi:hypothetical protein
MTLIFVIIIIFITIITTQMLQIASFLYFVCVPFTHAQLVIGPRAVELGWKYSRIKLNWIIIIIKRPV